MSADILSQAINLRQKGEFSESRKFLFSLSESGEYKGPAYLNIAWSLDNEGAEREALKYYLLSLEEQLSERDKFEAIFGVACTYRCLGDLHKADAVFRQLRREYPEATQVLPFHALCLSSLGKKDDAIRLLFELLLESTSSDAIRAYSKTLSAYVDAEYPEKDLRIESTEVRSNP